MTLENTLNMLDKVLPYVIIATGISLSFFLIASGLYSFVYYQKKFNLKKSKDIIEENITIVEDANFFSKNKKYQDIIEIQMDQIKTNAAKNKSLIAQNEDLEFQIKKTKKK